MRTGVSSIIHIPARNAMKSNMRGYYQGNKTVTSPYKLWYTKCEDALRLYAWHCVARRNQVAGIFDGFEHR